MPKISFFVRKSKESNVLYCRVSFNGLSSELSTGEKIELSKWDQVTQRHKNKNSIINVIIESLTFKLKSNSVLQDYKTPKDLIESLQPKKVIIEPKIFVEDLIKTYIDFMTAKQNHKTILNHLAKFNNFKKYQIHIKKKLEVKDFDLIEAEKFKEWYCETKKTTNISTASRNIEFYRKAFFYATKKGVIKYFDLALYEPERDKTKEPIYLSKQEVEKLIKHKFECVFLDKIRDLYLFQIGTGLSYCNLHDWKLEENKLGHIITGKRGKNQQQFFIPIDEFTYELLKKHSFEMPKFCLEYYNRKLKNLAKVLGIKKRLTTHSGRKTFATLQNDKGWSIESIAIMLGHSSIKTTETYYIGKSIKRLENEIQQRKVI